MIPANTFKYVVYPRLFAPTLQASMESLVNQTLCTDFKLWMSYFQRIYFQII